MTFIIYYPIYILLHNQMSPTANLQLKDGRLTTPSLDSLCGGLNLKIGKLYLIAGDSPNIGICNYAKEYSQMTIVERRGFAGGYRKGCPCEVLQIDLGTQYKIIHLTKCSRSNRCFNSKVFIIQSAPVFGNHSRSVRAILERVYRLMV